MFCTEHYRKLLKTWLAEYRKLCKNKTDETHKLFYLKARLREYVLGHITEAEGYPFVASVQFF